MIETQATVTTVLPTAENKNREQAKYSQLTKQYRGKAISRTPGIYLFVPLHSHAWRIVWGYRMEQSGRIHTWAHREDAKHIRRYQTDNELYCTRAFLLDCIDVGSRSYVYDVAYRIYGGPHRLQVVGSRSYVYDDAYRIYGGPHRLQVVGSSSYVYDVAYRIYGGPHRLQVVDDVNP